MNPLQSTETKIARGGTTPIPLPAPLSSNEVTGLATLRDIDEVLRFLTLEYLQPQWQAASWVGHAVKDQPMAGRPIHKPAVGEVAGTGWSRADQVFETGSQI